MMRIVKASLITLTAIAASSQILSAQPQSQQPSPTAAPTIKVCSLLPKEEVKKYLPWSALVDSMEPEEQAVGAAGSSCNYPSVRIQVLGRSTTTGPPDQKGYEPISDVGDEAYFRNNRNRFAELYVRVGKHTLTLQANADRNVEAIKPRVVDLAKALIAKLP
jgi:hypothetical protein